MAKKEQAAAKILVVDDEVSILRLLEMILTRRGLTVLKAEDGHEGYRMAVLHKPDAILLDINMPGMNGFELCSKLKATEETAQIPVAFLTARKEVEAFRTAQDLGSVLYIPKPFKPQALIHSVGVLLAARGKKI
ncbi:MAG: response regulator [Terriglobia bacterium]